MGDVALERGDGAARRFLAPQLLDEQFHGHDATEAYEEQCEQRPSAGRPDRQVMPVVARRHGAQDAQQGLDRGGGRRPGRRMSRRPGR
ncbi:hypothetical protein GCM10010324_56980 [Streptomyces hiroshimensis]|uniref:Uncharacterized protein n=1 Tax=Streptomyces hiroshimensis TaxID=66424 RepID=A0ABQ2Z675_9ACTN|nr:hypothetical protein GCM10010324_56980 [Streptomyces hiroshimensis]